MSLQTYRVYDADGMPHELLTVTIDGTLMTVDGPYWFGEGLLIDGIYVGRAYYKQAHGEPASPLKPVFHLMYWNNTDSEFEGDALFTVGSVHLTWVQE